MSELPPLDHYVKLLSEELKLNSKTYPKKAKSLYFGGGTPSLLSLKQFGFLIEEVCKYYHLDESVEITIEINPGTLSPSDVLSLQAMGVNRFSLGLQTFNPKFLKTCGRLHSPKDSMKDLETFNNLGINYSVDLLFGLPEQSLEDLDHDLKLLLDFSPPHVSPYNLTVPQAHFLNKKRACDKKQIEMMSLIQSRLSDKKIYRYELSNFAQKGRESLHNRIYWEDHEYLGFGLGAHSYVKSPDWGKRFWNTSLYRKYESCIKNPKRPHQKQEILRTHEALTDYLHTSLRQVKGLEKKSLLKKFGNLSLPKLFWEEISLLEEKGLISYNDGLWALTSRGFELSNEVFRALCFLEEDLEHVR